MENYRFQEVLCPFCNKKYMTRIYDEYDISLEKDGEILGGWSDICPKCAKWLFVAEGILEGINLDIYSEEKIHRRMVLR